MPRFLFHLRSHNRTIFDEFGLNLENERAAHRYAVRITYETLPYFLTLDPREWAVEVCDEQGETIVTVLFPPDLSARSGYHHIQNLPSSWPSY